MAHRATHRHHRSIVALLFLVPTAYLGVAGWEGSRRLVEPDDPSADCRTPASLGWRYEPINYDQAPDLATLDGADRITCTTPRPVPGDEVVTSDGVRLAGWWIPADPPGVADGPTVVMVHGYVDNKSGMLEYAALVHDRYNVVLFDLRNSGDSTGEQTLHGVGEQRDVSAMLDWLMRAKHPDRVVVFGQSMGGASALSAVVDDPRVDGLVLDSTHDRLRTPVISGMAEAGLPFGEVAFDAIVLGGWLRTGEDITAADPVDLAGLLGDRPLLLLHGERDAVDPMSSAERVAAAARNGGVDAQLHTCRTAGHGEVAGRCPAAYRRWLTEFLDTALAA